MENAIVYSNSADRRLANMSLLVGDNNYQVDYHRDLGYASDAVEVLWDDFDIQVLDCPAGIRSNASVAANNPLWCYPYFVVSSESEASYWT
jgi:septum formation inhibitor-activating ATPase MinD